MKPVQLFRALRTYDEAKDRLAKAEEKLKDIRGFLTSEYTLPNGDVVYPTFRMTTQHIIDSISEFKKAYYAYEELFIDWEWERRLEDMKQLGKAHNEVLRHTMRIVEWERMLSAREVW